MSADAIGQHWVAQLTPGSAVGRRWQSTGKSTRTLNDARPRATLVDPRLRDAVLADILIALEEVELPADRRSACRAYVREAQRPSVTWCSPRPGLHVIDGQELESDLNGLTAAYLAMLSPGRRVVRAGDVATPGAARPGNSIRNALAVAATFLEDECGLHRAAAAVRRCRVVRGPATPADVVGDALAVAATFLEGHDAEAAKALRRVREARGDLLDRDYIVYQPDGRIDVLAS
jgi:hypothetical protein